MATAQTGSPSPPQSEETLCAPSVKSDEQRMLDGSRLLKRRSCAASLRDHAAEPRPNQKAS